MSSEFSITREEHETTGEWIVRANVWLDDAFEFLRKKREEKEVKRVKKDMKAISSAIKKTARRLGKNRNILRCHDLDHLTPLFFKIYDRIRYSEKNPKKAKAIYKSRFGDAKRRKLRKRM